MKVLERIETVIGWIVKVFLISLYTLVGSIMLIVIAGMAYGLVIESIKALR